MRKFFAKIISIHWNHLTNNLIFDNHCQEQTKLVQLLPSLNHCQVVFGHLVAICQSSDIKSWKRFRTERQWPTPWLCVVHLCLFLFPGLRFSPFLHLHTIGALWLCAYCAYCGTLVVALFYYLCGNLSFAICLPAALGQVKSWCWQQCQNNL